MMRPGNDPAPNLTEGTPSHSAGAERRPLAPSRPAYDAVPFSYDAALDMVLAKATRDSAAVIKHWSRRAKKALWNDKIAVANVVMFMITAAIFLPAVAILVIYVQDVGENQTPTTAGLHGRGALALDQLTRSQGLLTNGNTAWEASTEPHLLHEIGLLSPNRYALDANKIEALQSGGIIADPTNGYLDYPELKTALGMERYEFYLRVYPIITSSIADPFATDPIKGKHVAYIGNITNHQINLVTNDFANVPATTQREIEAIEGLRLTTDGLDDENGFTSDWYQPANTNLLLYTTNLYNGGQTTGDIIADTSRVYDPDGAGGADPQTYVEHFWNYFEPTTGNFLYDAIVFGTHVDLDRWNTTDGRAKLMSFLDAGGAVIMLGNTNYPDGFATDCRSQSDCLLGHVSTMQPLTIPDSSNPIITVPNDLDQDTYATLGPGSNDYWSVCNDEADGFLPVVLDANYNPDTPGAYDCSTGTGLPVKLGVTASDRYDENGVLIISSYDVTQGQTSRVNEGSRFMSNLLNYALVRGAYLSYGPSVPDSAPVEAATRTMLVMTEQAELIDVRLTLYIWRS